MAPPEVIDSLRRRMAETPDRVSAGQLAQKFVDGGHLTEFQARRLIRLDAVDPRKQQSIAGAVPASASEEAELSFAPLEEEAAAVKQETADPQPEAPPVQLDAELTTLSDPIGQMFDSPASSRVPPPEPSQRGRAAGFDQPTEQAPSMVWLWLLIGSVLLLGLLFLAVYFSR